MKKSPNSFTKIFDAFFSKVTRATGNTAAFIISFAVITIWAESVPLSGF